METHEQLVVSKDESGQRLDIWCVGKLPTMSRAALQRAIKDGAITVNDQTVKPKQAVHEGDAVVIALPQDDSVIADTALPEIPIVFENEDVVVVNKPANVSAHAGVHTGSNTVSAWFTHHYPDAAEVGEAENGRAGIVHRLDKDTSGVMILAKNQRAYVQLKKQFAKRRVRKEYLALVFNNPNDPDGRIVQAIARSSKNPMRRTVDPAGKEAITEWFKEKVLYDDEDRRTYALLRVHPYTGRMHQIRVHLHWLGFPIVGDSLYTFKRQRPPQGTTRQMLHAHALTLQLPSREERTFTAELPEDFQQVITRMQQHER